MSKETIYCGSGKKQSEKWLKSSLCLSDIPKEHIFDYNGKEYVKVNININEEPNQFGKDVSVSVDTFKPESTQKEDEKDSGLPF